MEQYFKHRLYCHSKNRRTITTENSCLPFVSFLNQKEILNSSVIYQKRSKPFLPSKPKRLQKKIFSENQSNEPSNSEILKVVNTKNISPEIKIQNGNEKQHSLQKNSYFATKLQASQRTGTSKTMKKVTKLLKSSIYLNYDIINSSGIYSEQKHNIFMQKKWNTAKQDHRTYTQTCFNASPTKIQMKRTDFKAIRKKPRLKRMQTVPTHFQLTLSMIRE